MSKRISLQIDNQVAMVELARPDKLNALDLEMFQAIADAQKKLSKLRGLRAVVLSGAGKDFCSGLDVKSMMKDKSSMRKLLGKWLPWQSNLAQRAGTGWRKLPVPVIAAIHGRCWGGGMQIALGADFRMVHRDASLSVMEGKWGLIPDMGGTLALRELTGRDHAMRLAMTAEVISADEALQLGLVSQIAEDPVASAREMAAKLTERSPDAVAAVKRLYRNNWDSSAGRVLAMETLYQLRIFTSPNRMIAVRRQMGDDRPYMPARKW